MTIMDRRSATLLHNPARHDRDLDWHGDGLRARSPRRVPRSAPSPHICRRNALACVCTATPPSPACSPPGRSMPSPSAASHPRAPGPRRPARHARRDELGAWLASGSDHRGARARRRRRLRSIKQGIVHVEPPFAVTAAMLTLRVHLDDMPDDDAPLLIAPARTGWAGSPGGGSGRRHRRTLRHGRLRRRGGRHLVLCHRYPPCVRRGAWPSPPPRVAGRLCR